jgi:predicted site-specific integrase-resolvase
MGNKIYTREETRQLLKVSLGTLYNWDINGILKPKRIGRRNYYSEWDIQKALEKGSSV